MIPEERLKHELDSLKRRAERSEQRLKAYARKKLKRDLVWLIAVGLSLLVGFSLGVWGF